MNETQIKYGCVCGNYKDLCKNSLFLQYVTTFSGGNGRSGSKNEVKNLSTVYLEVLKGVFNTVLVPKYISWHRMIYLDTDSSLGTFPDVSSTRLTVRKVF